MATITLKKVEQEVKKLKAKVRWLERAVVVPFDDEGLYKKSFIKKVLRRASENPRAFYEFTKPGDLLRRIQSMR
ncbi:hypothetical protein A3J56_00670 [Candidatus Giovannonibacteria bacterium RIFCSPHIGHO2_02_FULL_46_20]|uniref:Uncharacterized protein n=1 Tax=Candidatus Giovannonibacteria bacterium RIFCSPHIGHO2_02_FULL_46_20 TaxID=1798338 RepID=A0A1F5WD38_9BACT|nr:MAG: hypothetical protein A3J56_00670 [Candidatus Giovannonibacteria bacterium RIFCSPHIGHO2_02_FULL_46_20]